MGKSKTVEIDMLHGPLYRKMLIFLVLMVLSSVLQLLFNAADIIVVGRYVGGNALAAVGATTSTVSLIVNFLVGFNVGVNYVVARDYASGNRGRVTLDVHTAILSSLIFSIAMGLIGMAASRLIMELIGTPEEIIDQSARYLTIYFAGLPGIALYDAGAAIVRSVGDTRKPMYFLFASGVLNVILNLFFVIVMDQGVAGVAYATTISNYVSCILMMGSLMRAEQDLRLHPEKLAINRQCLTEILDTGVPCAVQSSMFGITNVLIQSAINSLGTVVIAGSAAACNIENFVYILPNIAGSTLLTFLSQNVGAKKYSRIELVVKTALIIGFVLTLMAGIFLAIFGRFLMGLYSKEADIIELGAYRLMFIGPMMWMEVFMTGFSSALKGLGKAKESMLISVCAICGFRILWLNTVFLVFHTYTVILLSWPVSWVLITAIYIIYYKKVRNTLPHEDIAGI